MAKKCLCAILTALFLNVVSADRALAGASDWATHAHVTAVQIGGLDSFMFQLDVSNQCGSHGWYTFDGRFAISNLGTSDSRDYLKRVYATVLAAKLTGEDIYITGASTPESGNCVVGSLFID
jgi:hypothetical protein